MSDHRNEPIAVVGIGCRFPGGCDTSSKLWELLKDPRDLSQEIPPDRFNVDRFYHKTGSHHGTTNVRRAYMLSEDISQFDHQFFSITPDQAAAIDPQQRLLLEVTYEAVESMGCTMEQLHGSDTAVFVGMMNNDYLVQQALDVDFSPKYNATGVANSNASSRVSYFFDWHGPSMTLDTACSSSLVAVHEAVQAIRNGTSKVAVAAGTNLALIPLAYITSSNLTMLSPTGKSRMWDADADGYARGEGVASVVLKKLSDAIRDGDTIHTVIREIGLNHDGRTAGLTMPSAAAQAALIRRVYRQAGLDPCDRNDRCQFFEAHGTGTPTGDPQEAEALSMAFFDKENSPEDDMLYVGSIKTIIGHTESTAGLAGLLRATFALKHGIIPPNLLFNRLNPAVAPFTAHLRIPTTAQPWPAHSGSVRRASVNSFGFGGANAHVILESYDATNYLVNDNDHSANSNVHSVNGNGHSINGNGHSINGNGHSINGNGHSINGNGHSINGNGHSVNGIQHSTNRTELSDNGNEHSVNGDGVSSPASSSYVASASRSSIPFVFSAATAGSLNRNLRAVQTYLEQYSDTICPASLAHHLVANKSAFAKRISFSAESVQDLGAKITHALEIREATQGNSPASRFSDHPSILGVFTGQGAQWATMGTKLIASIPLASAIIDELDLALSTLPEDERPRWTLMQELLATGNSRMSQAEISQPLCTAVQIVLVDLLRAARVQFSAVAGHSSGEIAAAYAAGFLNKRDAIRISFYRGYYAKLASGACGLPGAMLAVGTSFDDAQEVCNLDDFAGHICIAAHNSPESVTLSGDAATIERARFVFEEEKKFARTLKVDTAYHSHHMKPCKLPYLRALRECGVEVLQPPADTPMWYSSVHDGELMTAKSSLSAEYWVDNMSNPVLFSRALAQACESSKTEFTFAVEVGPHPALKTPTLDTLKTLGVSIPGYAGALTRGKNDAEAFTDMLGALWTEAGSAAVDLLAFEQVGGADQTSLQSIPDLPKYSWNHDRRLWCEARSYKHERSHDTPYHDFLGRVTSDSTTDQRRWRNVLDVRQMPWLNGHALQGQTVFPATGYIALAMESATQVAGSSPVHLIELLDLDIAKAIVISEAAPTELVTYMSRITWNDVQEITAEFSVYSAVASKESGGLTLNCRGDIRITLETKAGRATAPLPARDVHSVNMSEVDVERFYSSLRDDAGYTYEVPFRNITQMSRRLGLSTGTIQAPEPESNVTQFVFHPGIADCALQGMFATYSAPGDGSIMSIMVPKGCRRVSLVPSLWLAQRDSDVNFVCSLTDNGGDTGMAGDIDLYSTGYENKMMQFEALTFVPFAAATKEDDKSLFQEAIWCPNSPDGKLVLGDREPTAAEKQKALDAERAAFFYMCKIVASIEPDARASLPWYRQSLLDETERVVDTARNGTHPYANGWLNDTAEEIVSMMDSYGDDADFNITRAVGEHLPLPEVMSGEVNILEYMAQNDYLGRYYREAAGFESLNDSVGGLVAQITNKYPHMNFCEVGAGTGGATKAVLDVVGNAFASYTYTDISGGFFETAQARFHAHQGKMTYKTLNIEHDPVDQGFVAQTYDCVVAANVLHATKSLETTLRNVRALLKPGGYLILFEIIGNNVMRIPMVMGGLPGWWIGHEDGRKYAPTIELEEWDTILRRTGFSGVDTHTPMTDKVSLPGSIFCSMACDEQIDSLRNPLAHFTEQTGDDCLVILQGANDIGKQLPSVLEPHFGQVIVAENLDSLPEIPARAHILSLQDYGDSMFENLTENRWNNLQKLLESPQTVLWVTSDAHCSNPYAGMSTGLFRSLYHELMGCLVQTLDCESGYADTDLHTIAEMALRLKKLSQHEDTEILWTIEPELRLRNGRLEVQRVRSARERNDRLNSYRRPVFQGQDARIMSLHLRFEGGRHIIEELQGVNSLAGEGFITVKVTSSFLLAVQTPMGHAFICLGFNQDTGEKVLCLSETNSSRLVIHKSWTRSVSTDAIDRQYLSLVIGALVNQQIVDALPPSGALLAYDPDPGLASLLSKQMSIQNRSVLFITSRPKMQHHRGKWVSLHTQCTSRTIAGIIPNGLSTYLYSSHLAGDSERLDERVRQLLSTDCHIMDADVFVSRRAAKLPREATSSVTDLLQRITEFAESQLNGIPDGVALETISLHDIVLAAEPFDVTAKFLVDWDSDVSAPVKVKPLSSRTDLFSGDKTYWLAGLSGDLGRSLADFMIAHGAGYIVLSSRTPKEEKPWVDWHLSEHGAVVKYFQSDVSDFASVDDTFRQITESMPALGGVALGALVLCDRMFAQMKLDEFKQVMEPKVQGTLNFSRIFSPDSSAPPLEWFIGFSSIVATMGNPGQANYSAANCFIKAVINQRRAQGLSGSVIDISRVIGVGYVEREMKSDGRLTREQKERLFTGSMTLPMSETDLHQLFAEAIVSGRPSAINDGSHDIITGMAPVRKEDAHHKAWPNNPKFGLLVKVGEESVAESGDQASNRIPIKKLLAKAESREEMDKIVKDALIDKLRVVLFLSGTDAPVEEVPLIDIGVDSLVGVEIRAWCLKEFDVDVPVMKILGGISLSGIVEQVLDSLLSVKGGEEQKVEPEVAESGTPLPPARE